MGTTTYTYTATVNGDLEDPDDWSSAPALGTGGGTSLSDSFLLDSATTPTTVSYSDNNGIDGVYDLTIDSSNFTVEGSGQELNVQDGIIITAGTLDIGDGGEITFQSPNLDETQVFIVNDTLEGTGYIDAQDPTITGTGTIIAVNEDDGTALEIGTGLGGSLTVQIQAGAIAQFDSSVGSGVTVNVATGGSASIGDVADFQGTISGLGEASGANQAPNFIDLVNVQYSHVTPSSITYSAGVITVADADGQSGTIDISGTPGPYINFIEDANGGTEVFFSDTVCFAAGVHILTPGGEVPVERLSVGNEVIAVVNGERVSRPIKWIGHRKVRLAKHAHPELAAPIRFKAGAFSEGVPSRDLVVSPEHCMIVDGHCVPAKLLVNGSTIAREYPQTPFVYYHVELEQHSILIADGAEAESYLDTGNRAWFDESGEPRVLHPTFEINANAERWQTEACAPLATTPEEVAPIWQQLADRALALGFQAPKVDAVEDADVHLMVDGRRIEAVSDRDARYVFAVPAGAKSVVLASRSAIPADKMDPMVRDSRRIGLRVLWAAIRAGEQETVLSADHPALQNGWHAVEMHGSTAWRWTNGAATIPWDNIEGSALLTVRCDPFGWYPVQTVQAALAA